MKLYRLMTVFAVVAMLAVSVSCGQGGKKPVTKKIPNPVLSYVRTDGNVGIFVIVNVSKYTIQISQKIKNEFINANTGKLTMVSSINSEDLTKPVPIAIATNIMNGMLDCELGPKDFMLIVMQKK